MCVSVFCYRLSFSSKRSKCRAGATGDSVGGTLLNNPLRLEEKGTLTLFKMHYKSQKVGGGVFAPLPLPYPPGDAGPEMRQLREFTSDDSAIANM